MEWEDRLESKQIRQKLQNGLERYEKTVGNNLVETVTTELNARGILCENIGDKRENLETRVWERVWRNC